MNKKIAHPVRIIPRLDIKGPNLVKGLAFDANRVLGTAHYFGDTYYQQGADEIIFYDTVASLYRRNTLTEFIQKTAEVTFVPMTVCGGIRTVDDVRSILRAGADKVGINTAATENPELIKKSSSIFGSQCIVSVIEYHYSKELGFNEVWVDYGRQPTGINAFDWAQQVEQLGAGEILLMAIERDGFGEGFDTQFIRKVSDAVSIPVIAGCGAGQKEHFKEVIESGHADAVCAASTFHYHYATAVDQYWMSFNEPRLRMGDEIDSGNIDFLKEGYGGTRESMVPPLSIKEVKEFLIQSGITVRHDVGAVDLRAVAERSGS